MPSVEIPPRAPEHDELDALIEEARRRASRRRCLYGLALVAAILIGCGLYLGFSGGGRGGGSTGQSGSEPAGQAGTLAQSGPRSVFRRQFTDCPDRISGGRYVSGGWSSSVSGMSCERASRVIPSMNPPHQRQPIRTTPPYRYRSRGFNCLAFALVDGGGFHVLCGRGAATVSFYFTP
jgi:hypothetical protein